MTDLTTTIAAKSDQLNADDLIGRTLTIKVSAVRLLGEAEQPIAIHYDGDNGKPFKPCKSMRRLLVHCWKGDGNQYVGRQMTLYRDGKVKWGGLEVGGIRISHLSHIDGDVTVALTAKKGDKKAYTVKPLATSSAPKSATPFDADTWSAKCLDKFAAFDTAAALSSWFNSPTLKAERETAGREAADVAASVKEKFRARMGELVEGEAV